MPRKILDRDCAEFLVIDDDSAISTFLSAYLKRKGHSCAALTEGFQTAAWLELHDCEVVVVDLNMPKVDGISLITFEREIRPNLPIIVFAGVGYEEEKTRRAPGRRKRLREQESSGRAALLRALAGARDPSPAGSARGAEPGAPGAPRRRLNA